jgi:hypothetical protein
MMALSTGCASGGFKLTREYARWVNSKQIILRIVLYIFTFIVFTVTLLIDMVLFNTMDFWEGKVSAGDYQFKDKDKTYLVKHEFINGTDRKQSTIHIVDADKKLLQTVLLTETVSGEIEMYIDGKLKTRVSDISTVPVAKIYNADGTLERQDFNILGNAVVSR